MNPSVLFEVAWSHVVSASLHGAALIVVVAAIQRVVRRRLAPAWCFALWFLVLLRLSLPLLPSSSLSWQRVSDALVSRFSELGKMPRTSPKLAGPVTAGPFPYRLAPVEAVSPSTSAGLTPTARFGAFVKPASIGSPATATHWKVSTWLGLVWMVGALVLLFRQGLGTWLFRRQLRQWPALSDERLLALAEVCRREIGIGRRIRMVIAPRLESPCLYGVIAPVVLLPAPLLFRLTDSEWRNILLHEFGHVRRLDPLWNLWMSLVAALHWFNPLVWWAVRRMREDRELACDSLVLARADSEIRHSYGETLLKLASFPVSTPQPGATMGILENGGPLKSRLRALGMKPAFWRNTAVGIILLCVLAAFALTRKPDSTVPAPIPIPVVKSDPGNPMATSESSSPEIQPINLSSFTDFPQPAVDPNALQRHQDDPGIWAQIPKGEQSFFGVPFDITGLIRLAGVAPQRDNEWYFRPEVVGIPIGRMFARIYLLHATYYFSDTSASIAVMRLNYADGTVADLPIRYGDHVLNYWRQRYETTSHLRDPDSRIAWTGDLPERAEYGNTLRLCLSSFLNPYPLKSVLSVDFFSTGQDSTEVVAGMAVGEKDLPSTWRSEPVIPDRDTVWNSSLRFRAVDAVTGEPIAQMQLRLEVAEPGVHSRIGTYFTDSQGWATLMFPHPELNYVSIWADRPGYVPRFIQWTRRQHGSFPEEYLYRANPGLRISGRVEDEQGSPIAGAIVRVNGPRPDFAGDAKEFLMLTHSYAITDSEGRWSCSEIPQELNPEKILLRVIDPDFPLTISHTLTPEDVAGAEILTRLSGGISFTTKVLNPEYQPVVGAKVLAQGRTLGDQIRGATTDAEGSFTLRLPAAIQLMAILIQADGYAPYCLTNRNQIPIWPTDPVILDPGRSIGILVFDEQGTALEGALVEASYSRDSADASEFELDFALKNPVTTDWGGAALWEHAPKEGIAFQVKKTGYVTGRIPVPSGATQVSISLTKTEEILGRVTDEATGLPVEYFKVWQGKTTDGEIVWQSTPIAIGRSGQYRVTVVDTTDETMVFRLDSPGYNSSAPIPRADLWRLNPLITALKPL